MQAICQSRYGGPEVLVLDQLADPIPGPEEVLIDVEAVAVTPGDCKRRSGELRELFPLDLPAVPGGDGTGTIVAVGTNVNYAHVGDAVYFLAERTRQGSYAERIIRDATSIVAIGPEFSFAESAAAIHAAACAWISLVSSASVAAGQTVLVLAGAGAIGGMAVQLARHLGAITLATCRSCNADYVRGLGADLVLAYDEGDIWKSMPQCDVVLDLVGGQMHDRSYAALRKGGKLVWLAAEPIIDRSAEFNVRLVRAPIDNNLATRTTVIDLMRRGILRPQVSKLLPLAQATVAHHLVEARRNSCGRIVLDVRGKARMHP